jgi:hypothetical protein
MKSDHSIIRGSTSTTSMLLLMHLLVGSPNAAFAYVRSFSPSFPHRVGMTTTTTKMPLQPIRRASVFALGNSKNDNDDVGNSIDDNSSDDEIFLPTQNNYNDEISTQDEDETQNASYNYLDDLTPPPVNFARNSILFSEQPSTKLRNNPPLTVWKLARTHLPAVLTGAWPWKDMEHLDDQPLGALYNVLLVRLPVLGVTASYLYQKIAEGHDLVIDLGFDANGPQAVPPVLVIAVLVLILL